MMAPLFDCNDEMFVLYDFLLCLMTFNVFVVYKL